MPYKPSYCKAQRHSRAGFSLIELMIATFIGLLGLGAAMSMASWQVRSTNLSRLISEATAVGQEQLEIFDQIPFADLKADRTQIDEFDLSWTVVPVNRCKVVQVRIEWGAPDKRHQLVMASLYADPVASGYSYNK